MNHIKNFPVEDFGGTQKPQRTETKKGMSGAAIFFMITTVLLLIGGGILLSENVSKQKQADLLSTKVDESEARFTDLDSKYTAAIAELDSYKGRNAELDSMLSVREQKILDLQASLGKEKKKGQMSEADYNKKLQELSAVINDLNLKVDGLQKQNVYLVSKTDSLNNSLMVKEVALTDLQNTNRMLQSKVTVASLLIPEDLEINGSMYRNSGKEVETQRAEKTKQLKICFTIPENKVADAGKKTFYARIINPEGSVIAIQDQGSGTLYTALGNEERQFTVSGTVDYSQEAKDVCMYWSQKVPFAKGNYSAEIYQDGYLVANKNFELK